MHTISYKSAIGQSVDSFPVLHYEAIRANAIAISAQAMRRDVLQTATPKQIQTVLFVSKGNIHAGCAGAV
jgi:hypothetical protein